MVFWKTYPIKNIIKRIQNKDRFTELIFERENINSPTGYNYEVVKSIDYKILKEIQIFIKTNFGSPPNTPVLDIPINILLNDNDIILYVRDKTGIIAGCIRYHYLGEFIQEIYCEDCFCIHPNWRKKGVGDYLLTQLHMYVNKNNIPYSMFLKEGTPLTMINIPFYSGIYVYKKVEQSINPKNIINLSIESAYKLIDIFKELDDNLFIIRNNKSKNQIWKLYKNNTYIVLACFQNTYQTFEEEKKQKIGWITAWFESPNMTDNIREEASNILADSMYNEFDYIWSNKLFTSGNKWKVDGPFHWYLYQWTTNISIKRNYCILT